MKIFVISSETIIANVTDTVTITDITAFDSFLLLPFFLTFDFAVLPSYSLVKYVKIIHIKLYYTLWVFVNKKKRFLFKTAESLCN